MVLENARKTVRAAQHGRVGKAHPKCHRVTETDQFRIAGTTDWLFAADIKAMFAAAIEPSPAATPAAMASRILCRAAT